MNQPLTLEQIKLIKARHEKMLLTLPNVVGVGVGFIQKNGQFTDDIGIIVNVSQKIPLADLPAGAVIPTQLDGAPVDVQEVGVIRPLTADRGPA
jgi:hypothetical protein